MDDMDDEDKEVLLNDFKRDYNQINNNNDLEQGLTTGNSNRINP